MWMRWVVVVMLMAGSASAELMTDSHGNVVSVVGDHAVAGAQAQGLRLLTPDEEREWRAAESARGVADNDRAQAWNEYAPYVVGLTLLAIGGVMLFRKR